MRCPQQINCTNKQTMKTNSYEYSQHNLYAGSTSSYPYSNIGSQAPSYGSSWQNNTNSVSYKSKYDNPLLNSQSKRDPKHFDTYSTSMTSYNDYKDVKRLPEQYSNLRQTFDSRNNNRIKDMIAKIDSDDKDQKIDQRKYDRYGNASYKADSSTYRNAQLEDRLKKYSSNYEKANSEIDSASKMSEEIKKLKEDRRKRLEAKQKEDNDFMLSASYSSINLGSSYKPQPSFESKYDNKYDTKKYQTKDTAAQQRELFKKKKSLYDNDSTYTPKYEKKSSYKEYSSPISSNYDKYKQEKVDVKTTKYDYKAYESSHNTPLSTYTAKTISSPSSKKLSEPVQYVEVNNFILGKTLGEGKFGIVYQAIHKPTKWLYAIKKIPKQMIKSHFMEDQFILELKLQTFLYHENILSLYTHFDDKTSIYLVLEYMEDGTLFSHLKKNRTLPEAEVAIKIKQIASAVKYLHDNKIAHRDIKPQNVVISHGVCKLCDFGWATICDNRRKTYCGTFDYAPPEILQGEQYDYTVDLWCLGVLAYELLVGKAPFYHISRKQTMKKILNVENTVLEYPENISKTAISFIDSLLKKDPTDRMSSQMVLEHPFLKNADKLPNKHH